MCPGLDIFPAEPVFSGSHLLLMLHVARALVDLGHLINRRVNKKVAFCKSCKAAPLPSNLSSWYSHPFPAAKF